MSEENKTIIKCLNMFGRVPEQWELVKEVEELQQENKQLKVKSEVLEENNKLLIQQKTQMYEDLDIAYEKIDKAIEYIKNEDIDICTIRYNDIVDTKNELLEILGDKENENNKKFR